MFLELIMIYTLVSHKRQIDLTHLSGIKIVYWSHTYLWSVQHAVKFILSRILTLYKHYKFQLGLSKIIKIGSVKD